MREVIPHNEIEARNKLNFFKYDILFVVKKRDEEGEEYFEPVGRAWAKPDHVRFRVGWEIKDCFDRAVPVDKFRFALITEIIDRKPIYVFVIQL